MKLLIDGDRIIVMREGMQQEIKSKPLRLLLCEATLQHAVCRDSDRSRAWQRIQKSDLEDLRHMVKRENGQLRWNGEPPDIQYNGRQFDATTASDLLESIGIEKRMLGAAVFEDVAGWQDVITALEFMRADSEATSITAVDAKLNNRARGPQAEAIVNVLRWLIQRRLSTVDQQLHKKHIVALEDAGIRFAVPYVEQLGSLWNIRRNAMLEAKLSLPPVPTAISPTLLSHKHEVDGFITMKSIRRSRASRGKLEGTAERVLHSFAVSLIYAAVGHRLGRAISCAVNLASTYIELSVGRRQLIPAEHPPYGDQRLLKGLQWLYMCCASTFPDDKPSLSERKLVRRCIIASLRRICANARKTSKTYIPALEDLVSDHSTTTNAILKTLLKGRKSREDSEDQNQLNIQFDIFSLDSVLATNEFCDLVELWRLALWRPGTYTECDTRLRDNTFMKVFLGDSEGRMVKVRVRAAVIRLARDFRETTKAHTQTTVHDALRHYASTHQGKSEMATVFMERVS